MGKTEDFPQQINKRTEGQFDFFLVEYDICPLCLRTLKTRYNRDEGSFKVCTNCGYEPPHQDFANRIPFNQEHFKPSNELAWEHSRGGTLQEKGRFLLVKQSTPTVTCPKCGHEMDDAPIMARHLSFILKHENPKMRRLLAAARLRCNEWGFGDKRKEENIIFSNQLGKTVRRVGKYFIVENLHTPVQSLADACFALTLKQMKGDEEYLKATQKLEIPPKMIKDVDLLLKVTV